MRRHKNSGFTLIELLVTVTIIGILTAIAYPSYTRYVTQTRRSDAHVAISQFSNNLEKYFGTCNSYTSDITDADRGCPGAGGGVPAEGSLGFGAGADLSPGGHYLITITGDNSDGTCDDVGGPCEGLAAAALATCQLQCGFTIVADPAGATASQLNAADGKFRMDSRGKKHWDRNNDNDYADAGEDRWK
jgi:type IV pilus assembly protein PilE